jgi:DNA-binding NarL/FixJ family response regulator
LNTADTKLRVLVADDHGEMRATIVSMLSPHFEVVGSVGDGKRLIDTALALRPDVVVSDISMPFLSGPQVINQLKGRGHNIPFVLVSGEVAHIQELIDQGAVAVVDKLDMTSELAQAVRAAASRQVYISQACAFRLK